MADVPLYHRRELPPERAGEAKPHYGLADESGKIRFGHTMTHFSGRIFDRIVRTRAANEEAEFHGYVNTALAEWENYVNNNPGASFEDLQKQRDKMMADIKAAGQNKGLTGIARRNIENWYKENVRTEDGKVITNEGLLYEKSQGIMEGIRANQEAERSDILLEQAIARRDRDGAADIIQKQSGTRYPAETVPLIIKEVMAEIDELDKKSAMESFGKALIDAAIIKDAEGNPVLDKRGQPTYDWNNAKKIVTNPAYLQAMGISLKDADSMLEDVMTQVKIQQDVDTAVSDQRVRSQFYQDIDGIMTGAKSKNEVLADLEVARFGDYTDPNKPIKPTLDETDYKKLQAAVHAEYQQAFSGAMSRVGAHARGLLLNPDSLGYIRNAPVRYKTLAEFNEAWHKWLADKGDKLKLSEIYPEGVRLAAMHQISDEEAERQEVAMNEELEGREKRKAEVKANPNLLSTREQHELIDFSEQVDEETRQELEMIVATGDIKLIRKAMARLRGTFD
jgi:hypothetical protein